MQHFDVLNSVLATESDNTGRPYDKRTNSMRKHSGPRQRRADVRSRIECNYRTVSASTFGAQPPMNWGAAFMSVFP